MKNYAELEQFIRLHYASLCSQAELYVDKDSAKDIVQEIIVKFWENPQKFKAIDSIDDFLFIMVRNESLMYLRKRQREKNRYAQIEKTPWEEPNFLHAMIEEETNRILLQAIKQLPPHTAHIVRLILSGYSNKEIAYLLDVSINTVKTLKYAAIRKLREFFEKYDF